MKRVVTPSPFSEEKSQKPSQKDFCLVHHYWGSYRWISRVLAHHWTPRMHVLEIGAKEGMLGRKLLKTFSPPQLPDIRLLTPPPFPRNCWGPSGVLAWDGLPFFEEHQTKPILNYTGVDACPRPPTWPQNWNWRRLRWIDLEHLKEYTAVVSNGVLYQLTDEELLVFGSLLKTGPDLLIFNEPARSSWVFRKLRLLRFFLNKKTVAALRQCIHGGFNDNELPEKLGLDPGLWAIDCKSTFWGSYRMIATKK